MFKVPLNQEVLADALGLSVVHINRTLRELRDDNLIRIKAGAVTLTNLPKLVAISGYVSPN
jgi:DNA-binding transcriptional regulator LsrR (DeoR family)